MLDIIIGFGILYGNNASRQCFISIIKYIVYLWLSTTIYLLKNFYTNVDKDVYSEILKSYYNIPYNVEKYFHEFPDAYKVIGVLIILNGIMTLYKHVRA